MPAALFARPTVARAECELLSLKLEPSQPQTDKLEHVDGEYNDKHRGLSSLAASYVPPVGTTLFERSSSHPTRLSSLSSFSSVSCLSLVSSLLERSSSFWPSLPRSRSGFSFSASQPPRPPGLYSDESDSDSSFDSDSESDSEAGQDEQWAGLQLESRAEDSSSLKEVNEVELLEYSKPSTPRDEASLPLSLHVHSAEPATSRAESEDSSDAGNHSPHSSNSTTSTTINSDARPEAADDSCFAVEWLRLWHAELTSHIRQRAADRRKTRRTLRSVLLIDDNECCHAQLSDSKQQQLTLTTRYRHMTLTLVVTQPAAWQRSNYFTVSADIHLPQLAASFASFVAHHRLPQPRSSSRLSFGLTPSASFSSALEQGRLGLQPLDRSSHPLARSTSLLGFVHSRLSSVAPHDAPPMLSFIRSQVWPLMLDFMQPATHEQSVPQLGAGGESADEESRTRQRLEASEARLAERQSRWAAEIRRMEERDTRLKGKENKHVDAHRRRGRQRERETTEERQVRPRKRTMEE